MRKLIATFSVLAALFSAPVVYAQDKACETFSKKEVNMAMEEASAVSHEFAGREAADFVRSLAEILVPVHLVDQFVEAAGEFSTVKVYVRSGNPTGLVILFDANDCATKTAELPVQVIGKALGKPTA